MSKTKVTIETLTECVLAGDREQLCKSLSPLTEKQRAALASPALELAEKLECWGPSGAKTDAIDDDPDGSIEELLGQMSKIKYVDWRVPRWTASLMVLGLCDREVFVQPWKFGLGWLRDDLQDMPERVLQILRDRKPKWLQSWLKREWKDERPAVNSYVERGLMRAGLIQADIDGEFFDRLCEDSMYSFAPDARTTDKFKAKGKAVERILEDDPELLESEIWGVFEHDSIMMRYAIDSWGAKLVALSQQGKLDRQRLLKSSVTAMSLPMMPTTLNGMGKFHELLAPNLHEREELLEEYLKLFDSQHATVVGHALKSVEELLKAKRLDASKFLRSLPLVFQVDKKTQPAKAIKMVQKLVKQEPTQMEAAAEAITAGLNHDHADIQEACIKFLSTCESLSANVITQIDASLDSVAATLRKPLQQLLASNQESGPSANPKKPASAKSATKASPKTSASKSTASSDDTDYKADQTIVAKWKKAAKKLPGDICAGSGFSAAIDRIDTPELSIDPVEPRVVPRMRTEQPVLPVESAEELIDLIATTIEGVRDVIDLERILDGISRFPAATDSDIAKRVGPLRKRVTKLADPSSDRLLERMKSVGFTELLTTWLDMPTIESSYERLHWFSMRHWFLRERIYEINDELSQDGDSKPLLALPTHTGGWIDPITLVQRFNDYYAKHRKLYGNYDLAQALLRLMPDGRAEALKMLGKPDNYNGGYVLRYALGDDCELRSMGGWGSEAETVAAARARHVIHPNDTPTESFARATWEADGRISIQGAAMADPTVPFTVLESALSHGQPRDHIITPDDDYWILNTWESLNNTTDLHGSYLAGNLTSLFDGEATWTLEACRLFLQGADHERGDTRIYATDAIIEAISRGLVMPETLGAALARLMHDTKLNRVSKTFATAADESEMHGWVLCQSIEYALVMQDEWPKDVHHLLAVLLEHATRLGLAPSQAALAKFNAVKGTSKTAKMAKQIAASQPNPDSLLRLKEAQLEILQQRCSRWQGS